jgi:SAM-dependent methyltransferase
LRMAKTLRTMARYLGIGQLTTFLSEVRELLTGITTGGIYEIPPLVRRQCPDAIRYVPTGYRVLRLIQSYVCPEDVFFELGCGKGRVIIFLASRCRVRRIVGIEIVPELAQIARKNIAKSRTLCPVQITDGDASQTDLSDGTVFYLFNPFGQETLRRVLDNIRKSLAERPRKVKILYYTPEFSHILDDSSWLQSEQTTSASFRVWHN